MYIPGMSLFRVSFCFLEEINVYHCDSLPRLLVILEYHTCNTA